MIGKTPRRNQFCKCGAKLRWEERSTPSGKRAMALCASSTCGRITFDSSLGPHQLSLYASERAIPDEPLRDLLLGNGRLQPSRMPWIRAFLRASRIPHSSGWRAGDPCWKCSEAELVFSFFFFPLQDPYSATLCLRCGAVMLRHGDPDRPVLHEAYGGEDWSLGDVTVDALNRAIRLRSQDDVWDLT